VPHTKKEFSLLPTNHLFHLSNKIFLNPEMTDVPILSNKRYSLISVKNMYTVARISLTKDTVGAKSLERAKSLESAKSLERSAKKALNMTKKA
jgi:hypothetical protein